jgi:sugar-specific transcriptional regulator TrmB
MTTDDEFISRLIGFGLSEKEALTYLYLLKYGPKTPSPLAKSLHTYREDVHRTLTNLIEKGMVRPSLHAPTVYAAVDLETALDSALKKQQSALRQMETRKRELEELSKQQRFRPSDEFSTFKIIKNLNELVAVGLTALESSEEEWLLVCPPILSLVGSLFTLEQTKEFIARGGAMKIITDVSYPYLESMQQFLDIGADAHHLDQYSGIYFTVFDRKICGSAINIDIRRASLNESLSMLWTDDPTYVKYLVSTFEVLWEHSVPGAPKIQELLKQGPPKS